MGAGLAVGVREFLWPDPRGSVLSDRVAALEGRVAALPAGNPAASLEPRIRALEAGVKQAGDDARAARAAAESAGKAGPAPDPGTAQAVAALGEKVESGARQTAFNATALGELGTKLEALTRRTNESTTAAVAAAGALQSTLREMQGDVGALKTGSASLEQKLGAADGRIADLSGTLAKVSTELARLSPEAIRAGLRIVVAGRLDDALRAGAPLGPALAALGKLGVDEPSLASLTPFAQSGVPSTAALSADFKPIAATLTAVSPNPDESITDKLKRLASKVVTVRAVGDGSGQDVPGLVARIEAALTRGALADAGAAWDRLPDAARQASAAWGARLKSRVAAEEAARRMGTQFLTALDAATR